MKQQDTYFKHGGVPGCLVPKRSRLLEQELSEVHTRHDCTTAWESCLQQPKKLHGKTFPQFQIPGSTCVSLSVCVCVYPGKLPAERRKATFSLSVCFFYPCTYDAYDNHSWALVFIQINYLVEIAFTFHHFVLRWRINPRNHPKCPN